MRKGPSRFLIFQFMFFYFLSHCCRWTSAQNSSVTATVQFNVGVILDLRILNGKMSNTCISMAVQDFYAVTDDYRTRLVLHTRHSKDVITAASAAVNLLKDVEVQAIVGPQTSGQAQSVAALGNRAQVPVISFSATSPSISSSQMPYFIRMTRNDTYQLEAIASLILAFKWKDVVLIYEKTEYGLGILPVFYELLQTLNVRVPYRSVIPPRATEDQILEELHKLLGMQTRVFIVHMSYSLAPLFFLKAKKVGLMNEGYAWIITEELTSFLSSLEYPVIDSMQGVLGIKPYIPRSRELEKFRVKLISKILQESATMDDVNIFCLHAYDSIWALAMAAEKVVRSHSFPGTKYFNNFSNFSELGISKMGPRLLKEILKSKFYGLSGKIQLVDGQLEPLVFQTINIVGQGEREIGFWIPAVGISLGPDLKTTTTYRTTQLSLRPIIWPGESTMVPKSSGKKLKIGYPVKDTFSELVKMQLNGSNNGIFVTGFCVDVFKEVMKALPYFIPYEFVPIQKANGEMETSYNDLFHQVPHQKYDALIGDITITANRSVSVDFSLPYTTGGVQMVIPNIYDERNNLLHPWLPMVVFWPLSLIANLSFVTVFILAFFEVLYMEYSTSDLQIGKRLRCPWTWSSLFYQSGGLKKVSQNAILTSVIASLIFLELVMRVTFVYSGHLTLMDTNVLVSNGDFVGYQKGSFVKMFLKQLNFDDYQLKVYNSPEEYDEPLSKGSQNGGVAAIFDEIPYIKLLLNKYPGKYRRGGNRTERIAGSEMVRSEKIKRNQK
ncbi:hypothetical protein AQUCO_06800026v1 [Aquilegia coerulea]|uniref:Glutamate receptor n=1 Tax=Aquilegia coerulea TaxID=218851 RepID=A0A2G5CBC2_AQUCA|nr:hypothetical protein AQUCO_06800026v1 [Aquilegia coerulea]